MARHPLRPHRWLIAGLLVLIVLTGVRFLALKGVIAPVRVVSGSMAERLLGEHHLITCYDCGFVFRFGVESPPPQERATCPNCGFAANKVLRENRRRGQRVLIDRGAYWFDPPARFDRVAFHPPGDSSSRLAVKRVIARPGEQLAVRQGELYIDEKLIRKSFSQFRQFAVVVHDDRYQPQHSPGIPPRWRTESDDSYWRSTGSTYAYQLPDHLDHLKAEPAVNLATEPEDWLVYHHWRCYANPYPRTALAPVADNSGYNQGESRELQQVVDLMLSCEVSAASPSAASVGSLVLRVHDGREWLSASLDLARGTAAVERGGDLIAQQAFPAELDPHHFQVDFGTFDQQIVVAMNGHELIRSEYEPLTESRDLLAQPLAIGCLGLAAEIRDLVVRRDAYFLDPANVGDDWQLPQPLAAGRFWLMGDNPSLSEDCRQWGQTGIAGSEIVGRVLPLPW